jgi:MoxR-like ATPase
VARATWVQPAFYAATQRIVDEGLRRDGSLFTPGSQIWTEALVVELDSAVSAVDRSEGTFGDKLAAQLRPLSPSAVQLAAELLYVALLPESDTGSARKEEHVIGVLSLLTPPAPLPNELAQALPFGIATFGQGGRNVRDASLRYLTSFLLAWKRLDDDARQEALGDPWQFRKLAHEVVVPSGQMMREAFLHLVFPDVFETIVSASAKAQIASAFAHLAEDDSADVDRRLASIRGALAEERDSLFSFYEGDLRAEWDSSCRSASNAWFIRGANDGGVNRVPAWLESGYISIGWDDALDARPGMSVPELVAAIRSRRPEKSDAWLRMGAGNLDGFFHRFETGDLVVTVDGTEVYVGRVTGEAQQVGSGDEGAVWRRAAEWLNAAEPADRTTLPADLQSSLKTQRTLSSLTKHLEAIEALIRPAGAWDELLHWAQRIYETPGFDADERDYKLEAAANVEAALDAHAGRAGDWLARLRRAFGPPNNLTSWRAHGEFLDWADANPDDALALFDAIWTEAPDESRFGELLARWPTRQTPITLLSFVLSGLDAAAFPWFRATVAAKLRELLALPRTDEAPARRYFAFVELLDELRRRLAERGVQLRDRIDAQGIAWVLTVSGPPASWDAEEQAAFRAWRGDSAPDPVPGTDDVQISPLSAEQTEDLLLTQEWLAEIVDLLNEKRQAVFYGPPGTGKTFVAQELAKHVQAQGGTAELVQFHPAYSYEDFFEGYRPRLGTANGVEFELRPGPLRRIADAARDASDRPHLLVIDEINRGNIAKIFGELYFLLEYRDRAIRLQYSPESRFRLPDNLFVIGTMNTADRSIALVDSALRRRFYFVSFLPRDEPLRFVLRRWLERKGHASAAADYLDALNAALATTAGADEELAIGPSYFITRGGGPPDLDRVWRHAILPLLEERFFGARRAADIENEFSPRALLGEE